MSFEGSRELFERTFDTRVSAPWGAGGEIAAAESPSFDGAPKLPEDIEESVDSVYFPTRPSFHRKERKR